MDNKTRIFIAKFGNYLLIAWVAFLSIFLSISAFSPMNDKAVDWIKQCDKVASLLINCSFIALPIILISMNFSYFRKALIAFLFGIWLIAISIIASLIQGAMHITGEYSGKGEGFAFVWGFLIVWCFICAGIALIFGITFRILEHKSK